MTINMMSILCLSKSRASKQLKTKTLTPLHRARRQKSQRTEHRKGRLRAAPAPVGLDKFAPIFQVQPGQRPGSEGVEVLLKPKVYKNLMTITESAVTKRI